MRNYIPQEKFEEIVQKCGLKLDRIPYTETIKAVFLQQPLEMTAIDFQVLVLAGKRSSAVRVVYGCEEIPQVAAFDYKAKLPVNLGVQREDFYYSWAEAHAYQD
jgi:hypothetical protein